MPAIKEALEAHTELPHIKVYDGKGKSLGRAFKVKLWPTLVLMRDGQEIERLVRPVQATEISLLLNK
jgi:thioredoxin 1